jgi:hypothetical protein
VPKIGEAGAPTPGRKKGQLNKTTALLKDAIIEAATKAGQKEGLVGYLTKQADDNPAAFLTLLGKVLPLTLQGDPEKPLHMQHEVKPADRLKQMVTQIAERSGEAGISLPN